MCAQTRGSILLVRCGCCRRSCADWVQQLFSVPSIAKQIRYHDEVFKQSLQNGSVFIRDVYDGEAYRKARQLPYFRDDPRHLYLAIVSDGFLPFKDDAKFSCYPFVLVPLNFPPHLR